MVLGHPRYSSWGKFASYPHAFAAAAKLKDLRDAGVQIRIMVPTVTEFRGKDYRGHDIVLGRPSNTPSPDSWHASWRNIPAQGTSSRMKAPALKSSIAVTVNHRR
ncbi:hypothetical protein [Arthrobacter sp. R4-81]